MARRVRLHSPSHPGLVLQRAGELRRARTLCDALVRVGQRDFLAHSLVLACTSHTLARLLLPQGPSKLCSLDFLAATTFQHALDFAYTGCLEVATEELASLLVAAQNLEMEELEQACLRALRTEGHDRVGSDDGAGSHDGTSIANMADGRDGVDMGDTTDNYDRVGAGDMAVRHDETGIGNRAGGHDRVGVGNGAGGHDEAGNMAGSHDEVSIGDGAGGHDGVGDVAGSHDEVGVGNRAGSHDRVGVGDGPGSHDGVSIGDRAGISNGVGGHDGMGTQDTRKEMTDELSPVKSVVASPVGETVAPGNHDVILLANGPCLALARQESQGNQIQDDSLAPSWVLFEQSSLKPRGSVITASARTLAQECRTHPWPPEVLWGPEGMVASYQPCPPSLSYQLRSPLGNLGPRHVALSESMGFHSYGGPFPCGLETRKPGNLNGTTGREEHVEDQRLLAAQAKSSGYDLCPWRSPDVLHPQVLCYPRPQLLHHPPCRAQQSCDEDPLNMAPPGERAASASSTLYLMYGPRCPSRALPAGTCNYTCQLCQQRFPSQMALRSHNRSHRGERLSDHEFCARGGREEARQRGHRRVHAGEKPYKCGECSKCFTLKHQMETHYRVHTGEKPFQCKLCPQRSRDYSAMIKHLRTHGGAAPYRCTLCCQFCPSLAAMQKHMKGHRPEELPSGWTIETTYLYSSSVSS